MTEINNKSLNSNKKTSKVGITFGSFELIDDVQMKILEDAKLQCDYLICGLQTDLTFSRQLKTKTSKTVVERYIQLKECKFVDEIVPYATEQDLEDILRSFNIHVLILGNEYADENFIGKSYCEQKGIELYFNR